MTNCYDANASDERFPTNIAIITMLKIKKCLVTANTNDFLVKNSRKVVFKNCKTYGAWCEVELFEISQNCSTTMREYEVINIL